MEVESRFESLWLEIWEAQDNGNGEQSVCSA